MIIVANLFIIYNFAVIFQFFSSLLYFEFYFLQKKFSLCFCEFTLTLRNKQSQLNVLDIYLNHIRHISQSQHHLESKFFKIGSKVKAKQANIHKNQQSAD